MMGIFYKEVNCQDQMGAKTHLQLLARVKKLCIVNKILDVLWIMTIE